MADELKAKGNAAFSAGQYAEAIKWFSQAIEKDSGNHVLYSNRSASYASLQDYAKALEDAKQCVSLKPDWSKGYSRLGAAYFGLHEWDDARSAYEAGIRVDPANEQLKSGLEEVKKASAAPRSPFGSPEMLARLATDPRTRGFMAQPDFMAMISDLKANPSAATRYISDPRFQLALQVGLGLNFGGGGGADEREAYANDDDSGAAAAAAAPEAREPAAPKPPPPQQQQPAPAPESEPVEDDSEEGQRKRAAEEAKEAGNAAYKRRAFEDAIAHYNRALELYDGDIVYLINRAAVRVEMGDAEGAIADCDTAVERGRELRADFKLIAKALARKGTALVKAGRLEEAVPVYQKALTEHRNADTLKKLQEAEKALKDKKQREYVDLDLCNAEKEAGNKAFSEGRYPEAVKHYTEALARGPPAVNPDAFKLHSNLAACYTKLGAWQEGLRCAEKCIELNPGFAKGYARKGSIQYFMKEYEKAITSYQAGLDADPGNEECRDGLGRCMEQLNRLASGMASEEEVKERQAKAMADPEIQNIMMDPVMQNVLKDMQSDPRAAKQHMANPGIAAKISRLVTAGILQVK